MRTARNLSVTDLTTRVSCVVILFLACTTTQERWTSSDVIDYRILSREDFWSDKLPRAGKNAYVCLNIWPDDERHRSFRGLLGRACSGWSRPEGSERTGLLAARPWAGAPGHSFVAALRSFSEVSVAWGRHSASNAA